uniref:Uncharacterized protein n=1 Tax=Macaca fascicularis TaxID=9541 RepID=A0A7N9IEE8_MACFA
MAGYTPETKLPEQELDSNIYCSAIFYLLQPPLLIPRKTGSRVDLKQSPMDLQLRVLTVRRKINKQKGHPTKTPSVHHHHQRLKADKTTKMGKKQDRKAGNSKNQSASPPPKEDSSSPETEQSWMKNDFDELREEGISRSNFSELKEELRKQCKETKNLGEKMKEWITRIIKAEKAIN